MASETTRPRDHEITLDQIAERDLAEQIKRAASNVVLNLAEAQRLTKGNKAKLYAIAHGSANEVLAALRTAVAWGWVDDASEQLAILDRLLALLWRSNHPKRA
ncbi:MAG: four helix bundle protein [Kofleriaceae bacterium]|nr:four helix bundle protein [Kofleriaceae bacterium]